MTRTLKIAAVITCALATSARAEVKTRAIEYKQGKTTLQGFLAWDDAAKGKRPGVLVVHEWWGHNEHARNQARRLAEAGYVGFALDMYGKGKVTDMHPAEAKAFVAEATKDPNAMKARFDAALAVLKKQKQVDPRKIGVVGYCFGGGVALDMARAGEDLAAVVTFHGSLKGAKAAQPGKVKPRILVQTGGADPMITKEVVEGFEKEMTDAGAKFEVITYPDAKHGFTNPDAGKAGMEALAYDADADQKSWEAAKKFLAEVFGS